VSIKLANIPGDNRGVMLTVIGATGIVCAVQYSCVLGAAGGVAVGTVALERAPMSREHDPREPGA
jgi:hypothetical protein